MREEIIRYLESVSALYPGGIPRSLSVSQQRDTEHRILVWGKKGAKVLFVADTAEMFGSSGEPFQGSQGSFLRSSIEKGLKLEPGQVALIGITAQRENDVAAAAIDFQAPAAIALGADSWRCFGISTAAPVSVKRNGMEIIPSIRLSEAAASQDGKRAYWEDLKRVIPIINS